MKLAIISSDTPQAMEAATLLREKYSTTNTDDADIIVALGGDGFMLQTMHAYMHHGKPIYGMNRGTVGFLMNEFGEADLIERISAAEQFTIHPLRMVAMTCDGEKFEHLAVNEVSMLRETRQAANLRVTVDGKVRLEEMVCDGLLVSTPAGSTAYNLSAHGPILPLGSNLLALTPLSAFRPRRWRGALLPNHSCVMIEVLNPEKRPVSATADMHEVRDVSMVHIEQRTDYKVSLLFDADHGLEDRIFKEQFAY